jgi:hypothetical protein
MEDTEMEKVRVGAVIKAITVILYCGLLASGAYAQEKPSSVSGVIPVTENLDQLREAFVQSKTEIERAAALAVWEKAIQNRILTDESFVKERPVVPVLKPDSNGAIIRCTIQYLQSMKEMLADAMLSDPEISCALDQRYKDSIRAEAEAEPGTAYARLAASGDQIPVSGFQAFARGSILRFCGTVRFPFVTRDSFSGPGPFELSGYVVRDDSQGSTNCMILKPSEWLSPTAIFAGDLKDPLSFLLLDDGLVYFHGSGSVRLNDGKTITFGSSEQ